MGELTVLADPSWISVEGEGKNKKLRERGINS